MTGATLRLGIDLDGVVADFNGGWMRHYNAVFDADLHVDMVTSWDGLHELTHFEDMQGFWRWARDHGGHSVFRHLEPYDGALETLHALWDAGHDVVVITAKPDWAIHDTLEWLADHRFPTREIHITDEKWTVDCDVYLDDSPYKLPEYVEHRADRTIVRFVRPWNRPLEGAVDVATWEQFAALVERMADGAEHPASRHG